MVSVILGIALALQGDPVRALEELEMQAKNQVLVARREAAAGTQAERAEFAERYNRLLNALADLGEEYRRGEGAVWPARSAENLAKAMRAFQSTAAWKQHEKLARK